MAFLIYFAKFAANKPTKDMTRRIITSLFSFAIILHAMAQKAELLNRPFQEFTKGAFVKYQDYHPSQFLTDNNWQIHLRLYGTGENQQT